jgi:hypothetical protein
VEEANLSRLKKIYGPVDCPLCLLNGIYYSSIYLPMGFTVKFMNNGGSFAKEQMMKPGVNGTK